MIEQQTRKPDTDELYRKLESIFRHTNNILNTVIVCSTAAEAKSHVELHEELESVLRRHVSDPLYTELLALNKVIVSLGGEGNERFHDNDE